MGKLVEADKTLIIKMYQDNASYAEILSALGNKVTSHNTISQLLKKRGVTRTFRTKIPASRCHYCLDDLTPEACYWIGMLMADGYVNVKRGYVQLQLQEGDKSTLCRFMSFFDAKSIMIVRKSQFRQVRSTVFSRPLIDRLATFGVIQRKSLKETMPALPHMSDFVRGFLDGDGTICINAKGYPMVGFVSSSQFILSLRNLLVAEIPELRLNNPSSDRNIPNLSRLTWTGWNQCSAILRWIYKTKEPAMERKLALADFILSR